MNFANESLRKTDTHLSSGDFYFQILGYHNASLLCLPPAAPFFQELICGGKFMHYAIKFPCHFSVYVETQHRYNITPHIDLCHYNYMHH